MKIRFVKAHGVYKVGDTLTLGDGAASTWVQLGYAIEETQRDLIEEATIEQRAESAVEPQRRRRRQQ